MSVNVSVNVSGCEGRTRLLAKLGRSVTVFLQLWRNYFASYFFVCFHRCERVRVCAWCNPNVLLACFTLITPTGETSEQTSYMYLTLLTVYWPCLFTLLAVNWLCVIYFLLCYVRPTVFPRLVTQTCLMMLLSVAVMNWFNVQLMRNSQSSQSFDLLSKWQHRWFSLNQILKLTGSSWYSLPR